MSNIFGAPKALEEARTVPKGDTVGSYNSYLDAQKAVDYLADQQFPVQLVSIVGNELKMVERVTGRLSYPRVALSGALSGMWFGLFVGVLLSFFSTSPGYFSIITSVLMGAAFFMLFGIVTYATQRGKRDFTSTSQVVATNYDVIVAFEASQEARRLLHQLPMTPSDAAYGPTGHYTQQDYQQQPFRQDQGGQTPQRPAGWSDPYGQRTQEDGQAGAQTGVPADAQAGQQTQQARAVTPTAARYPDLPDGRPQYGLRLSDLQAPPAQGSTNGSGPAPAQSVEAAEHESRDGKQAAQPGQSASEAPRQDDDAPRH
jgi:hypothetical protein